MEESNEEKGEPVGVALAAVSLGGRDVGRLASRKPRPPARARRPRPARPRASLTLVAFGILVHLSRPRDSAEVKACLLLARRGEAFNQARPSISFISICG